MAEDYRKDMTPQEGAYSEGFTDLPAEDPGRCRLRLRFALAADPALEKALGAKLTSIDKMPDDVMMGYFEKLRGLKP
jgi:hypothetical protein